MTVAPRGEDKMDVTALIKLLLGGQPGVQRPGGSTPATSQRSPAKAIAPNPPQQFQGDPKAALGIKKAKGPTLGELSRGYTK